MTMLSEAQKELQTLQVNIRRDNRKLEILQKLVQEYNGSHPNAAKLNEMILECLKENAGHADFGKIVDFLTAQYAFLSRQRISLALTKCPYAQFNKSQEQWELRETRPASRSSSSEK